MTDVFVSYSRRDKEFVSKLVEELVRDGRDIWVDWQDIPRAADWLNEIDKGIENSTAFIFVVSQHSLTSEICNHELEYALELNKRIVPLIRQDISGDTETFVKGTWADKDWAEGARHNWTAVGHLNWIFFNNDDDDHFKKEFKALVDTLDADLEHIKTHTRILVREREWEQNQRKPGYLMMGEEIAESEAWLESARKGNKNPAPTDMHIEYIEKSRAAENARLENLRQLENRTRQFRLAAGVLGIAIVLAVIAVFVTIQQTAQARNEAATSIVQRQGAETAVGEAQVALEDAEQRVDDANATLTPIPPTLTQSANDIAAAHQLVEDANATLTPIPPTLTQAASDIIVAQDQLAEAEIQVTVANELVATAEIQVEEASVQLTSIPPTIEALDLQIGEAEKRVEQLNLVAQALDLGVAASENLEEDNIELAALLAIRSLGYDYNSGADVALVNAANQIFTIDIFQDVDGLFIHGTTISSDGSLVAIGIETGAVLIIDTETGDSVWGEPEEEYEDYMAKAAFTPDNDLLVVAGFAGSWQLFDTKTGELLAYVPPQGYIIDSLAIHPDGEFFASTEDYTEICIYELESLELTGCYFDEDGFGYSAVAFSPDGDYLAGGVGVGVGVWEFDELAENEMDEYYGDHRFSVTAIDFSPDGNLILSAGADEAIYIWDREFGDFVQYIDGLGRTGIFTHAEFINNGDNIFTVSDDNIPRIWNWYTGQVVRAFGGHSQEIASAGIAQDIPLFVSVDYGGVLRIWDADLTVNRSVFRGYADWVTSSTFSPDGRYVVTNSDDAAFRVYDVENRFELVRLDEAYTGEPFFAPGDSETVYLNYLTGLGTYIIGDDDISDDYIEILDFDSEEGIESPAFTGDGETLIFVIRDIDTGYQNIKRFDFDSGDVTDITDNTGYVIFDLLSDQNMLAYTVSEVDEFTFEILSVDFVLHDLSTGEDIMRFPIEDDPNFVTVTPDLSRMIYVAYNEVVFYDLNTGEMLNRLAAHALPVYAFDMTADGRYLLTGGQDERIILYDVENMTTFRTYSNHSNQILTASFSPDGQLVASGGRDRTLQIWNVDINTLVDEACALLVRDLTDEERARYSIEDDSPTCP